MALLDYLRLALSALFARPIRTSLTLIGIFIGIAAVVALVSLGQGLDDAIRAEFERSGGDKIIIQAKAGGFGPPGSLSSGSITHQDIESIERVNGISEAGGVLLNPVTIEFNKQNQVQYAFSIPSDHGTDLIYESYAIDVYDGRMLRPKDRGKAMIGYDLAHDENVFGKIIKNGDTIFVNNTGFKVVGVMKRKGDPGFDKGVLLVEDELRPLVDMGTEDVSLIYARVSKGDNPETVAPNVLRRLRRDRGEKEGSETVEVQTLTELLESFSAIFDIVQTVLVGIALISLVVGAVGIMNTMYTSVVERTRDIGIMKSIGAKNFDILMIFFVESGILGLLGGGLGVGIGAGMSKLIEIGAAASIGSPLIKASYPPALIIGSLVFSTVIGVIAGVMPARQAAMQKPVDALRYE